MNTKFLTCTNSKTQTIAELLVQQFPDITLKTSFSELPWASLEWASFLSDAFSRYDERTSRALILNLFINQSFSAITFEEFLKALDEVG